MLAAAVGQATAASPVFQLKEFPLLHAKPPRWLDVRGRGYFDAQQRPVRLMAVASDATQRKQTEDVLLATYQSLKATWGALPDLVFELDRDGLVLAYNAGQADQFYTSPEGFYRRRMSEVLSPDAAQVFTAALAEAIQTGRRHGAVYSHAQPQGRRWFELSIAANGDSRAQDARFVCLARDITLRHQTLETLRESEERFRLLTEASFEGVVIIEQGRLTHVNDQLLRLLGYTREELIGTGAAALLPSESRDKLIKHIIQGTDSRSEHELIRKDGSRVLVAAYGRTTSIRDRPVRFIAVRDITEQRKAEHTLQDQRELVAHAGRLTLLGQLAFSLAHELNQPLAAILRNADAAELALDASPPPSPEDFRDILADIKSDSVRGSQVIERMRALIKRRKLTLELLRPADLIREVAGVVLHDAVARHVTLAIEEVSPALPRIHGDRVQLQQVLLNFVMNALHALTRAPSGKPIIRVRARAGTDRRVRIEVADSGPGVSAANLPLLFASSFFTTKPESMGVGLTISRTIIDAHGGHIGAENNPDRGATFWFELPAMPEASPAVPHPHNPAPPA
jgi:PAS domain S-box-containing protein